MKRNESTTALYHNLTKRLWKVCFAAGIFLIIAVASNAQGSVEENPDTPVPIDAGISVLVAAGVGYGIKKVYDAKKKKTEM
jgi:hypothetical protein